MTFLKAQADVSEFKKRYRWMTLFILCCFGVLAARLFQLQIVQGEHYARLAEENIVREVERPAVRGIIRDARGRILADNRPSYNVYITPHFFDLDNLPRLAEFLNLDEEGADELRDHVTGFARDDLRRFQPFLAVEDIDQDELAVVEIHLDELPGVEVEVVPVRTYPYGELLAHLLGYVNEITAEELEDREGQGYRPGDFVGRVGVEREWEAELRGERGWERVVHDARGVIQPEETQREVLGADRVRDPVPGHDLALTIDVELQEIVDRALRGHPSGAVVVLDVRTGRILAMVSKPGFDPNAMTAGLSTDELAEMQANPLLPLFNRPLMGTYSPGSTFKVVTALAALAEGIISPTERLYCGGYHELGRRAFRCSQAHGEVDLRSALVQSCNVYFYRLAERPGMMDAITQYAQHFGFGAPTGLGLGEAAGRVDSRDQHPQFRLGHALNAAIGQGRTLVTVLQLAEVYAAIAGGGVLLEPQIVSRVEAPGGEVIRDFPPRVRHRIEVPDEDLALVLEALVGVVNDPTGTAFENRIDGIEVAGKTGTAEVPRTRPSGQPGRHAPSNWFFNRDHAWFAGFAPAQNPRIAFAVLIEHGGTGGRSAAPVAMRIVSDYFDELAAGAPGGEEAPEEGSIEAGPMDDLTESVQ